MKNLTFYNAKPGELWGSEGQGETGDGLWIVGGYNHNVKASYDCVLVHWYENETRTFHLFKTISDEGWYMWGYEDMEFGLFDENFGIFYKRAFIDHLFRKADKIKLGKSR